MQAGGGGGGAVAIGVGAQIPAASGPPPSTPPIEAPDDPYADLNPVSDLRMHPFTLRFGHRVDEASYALSRWKMARRIVQATLLLLLAWSCALSFEYEVGAIRRDPLFLLFFFLGRALPLLALALAATFVTHPTLALAWSHAAAGVVAWLCLSVSLQQYLCSRLPGLGGAGGDLATCHLLQSPGLIPWSSVAILSAMPYLAVWGLQVRWYDLAWAWAISFATFVGLIVAHAPADHAATIILWCILTAVTAGVAQYAQEYTVRVSFKREVAMRRKLASLVASSLSRIVQQEQQQRLVEILKRSEVMMMEVSGDGIIHWISPACRALLGYDVDDVVRTDAFRTVVMDDVAGVREEVRRLCHRATTVAYGSRAMPAPYHHMTPVTPEVGLHSHITYRRRRDRDTYIHIEADMYGVIRRPAIVPSATVGVGQAPDISVLVIERDATAQHRRAATAATTAVAQVPGLTATATPSGGGVAGAAMVAGGRRGLADAAMLAGGGGATTPHRAGGGIGAAGADVPGGGASSTTVTSVGSQQHGGAGATPIHPSYDPFHERTMFTALGNLQLPLAAAHAMAFMAMSAVDEAVAHAAAAVLAATAMAEGGGGGGATKPPCPRTDAGTPTLPAPVATSGVGTGAGAGATASTHSDAQEGVAHGLATRAMAATPDVTARDGGVSPPVVSMGGMAELVGAHGHGPTSADSPTMAIGEADAHSAEVTATPPPPIDPGTGATAHLTPMAPTRLALSRASRVVRAAQSQLGLADVLLRDVVGIHRYRCQYIPTHPPIRLDLRAMAREAELLGHCMLAQLAAVAASSGGALPSSVTSVILVARVDDHVPPELQADRCAVQVLMNTLVAMSVHVARAGEVVLSVQVGTFAEAEGSAAGGRGTTSPPVVNNVLRVAISFDATPVGGVDAIAMALASDLLGHTSLYPPPPLHADLPLACTSSPRDRAPNAGVPCHPYFALLPFLRHTTLCLGGVISAGVVGAPTATTTATTPGLREAQGGDGGSTAEGGPPAPSRSVAVVVVDIPLSAPPRHMTPGPTAVDPTIAQAIVSRSAVDYVPPYVPPAPPSPVTGGGGTGPTPSRTPAPAAGKSPGVAMPSSGTGRTGGDVAGAGGAGGSVAVAPLSAPAPVGGEETRRAKVENLGLHVLFVDDEQMNRRLGGRMLQRLGCTVLLLEDGDQVPAALRDATSGAAARFDIILMDISMERTDGAVVCQELRDSGVALPIVAMTGHTSVEDVQKCMAAGFDLILPKPFNINAMGKALVEGRIRRQRINDRQRAAGAGGGGDTSSSGGLGGRSGGATTPAMATAAAWAATGDHANGGGGGGAGR